MNCPKCESDQIRSFSKWNENLKIWEWMDGCNNCDWEQINIELTQLKKEERIALANGETLD